MSPISREVDKLFHPELINKEGKPLRGVSIYLDRELPNILFDKNKKKLPRYNVISHDGELLSKPNVGVPITFPEYLRNSLARKYGIKFELFKDEREVSVNKIDGVPVTIRNISWKNKWVIIIDTGTVIDISNGTRKVIDFLLKNNIILDKDEICINYCGIAIDNIEEMEKLRSLR